MKRETGFLVALCAVAVACGSSAEVNAKKAVPTGAADPTSATEQDPDGTSASQPPGAVDTGAGTTSSGSVTAGGTAAMTVTNETITVAGEPRSYVLAAPITYTAGGSYSIVLVLHGDGGDGPSMRAAMPFDAASGQAAFVVYPTGKGGGWDLYTPAATNEDLMFLVALVDSLRARFVVAAGRVFATGFSSGAFMVSQTACRNATLFRGIAPQSGGAPAEPNDPSAAIWGDGFTRCAGQTNGSGPATIVVHGTNDTTVSYDSGEYTANYWAYVNACGATRSNDQAPCLRYDGCPASRPVVFCPVGSLGHSLWGGAAQTIWSFFKGL